ncbi:hypothetical protein [Paraburkholderia diazotrophica]|uniref:hypothetical protein n=1 Tax=Paraburkholderia diazotrophica TaxID=667676 RepID=UPI00317828AB
MSIPEAHISHMLAGRVRLKIPARRHDAAFFAEVVRRLAQCDGVIEARASPLTAGLLIMHATELNSIAAWASQQRLFSLHAGAAESLPGQRSRAIQRSARPVASVSGEQAVRRARLLSTSLAGLGALQTVRGQILAPAVTLFWYAYDARRGLSSIRPGSESPSEGANS